MTLTDIKTNLLFYELLMYKKKKQLFDSNQHDPCELEKSSNELKFLRVFITSKKEMRKIIPSHLNRAFDLNEILTLWNAL